MCYIITDGKYYVCSNDKGQQVVSNINQATKFKIEKANNLIKNLPKIMTKYNWKIEYANVENKKIQMIAKPKEINYNIIDKVNEIEMFAKDIQERYIYLESKLQKVELEIIDIRHAARFYTLNAAQGYKLYKLLHNAENERGDIKDEMQKIQYVLNGSMKSALSNQISKSIDGLDTRQYQPRVLKELFNV